MQWNATARRMRKNLRTFRAHGSDKRVPMRAFASLAQLIAWVKSQGCRVVGVEIDDSAVSCFSPEAWPVRPTCLFGNRAAASVKRRSSCAMSCLRPPVRGGYRVAQRQRRRRACCRASRTPSAMPRKRSWRNSSPGPPTRVAARRMGGRFSLYPWRQEPACVKNWLAAYTGQPSFVFATSLKAPNSSHRACQCFLIERVQPPQQQACK